MKLTLNAWCHTTISPSQSHLQRKAPAYDEKAVICELLHQIFKNRHNEDGTTRYAHQLFCLDPKVSMYSQVGIAEF